MRCITISQAIALFILLAGMAFLSGCSGGTGILGGGAKPTIKYSTLPTREIEASYPGNFKKICAAAERVIHEELGYEIARDDRDNTTGRARIEGSKSDGASVRVELERSRDLASTAVRTFAVPAGSSEASADAERDILERIENILWPPKKK
jgi:hypothetical protein